MKHTDLIEWWQVSHSPFCLGIVLVLILTPQNNAKLFPTLARIALDILPSQVSSVPCEQLFLGTRQIAVDRCAYRRFLILYHHMHSHLVPAHCFHRLITR